MQQFIDSQLFQWLQKYQEILLPIVIIIAILTWLSNLILQNAKVFEYLSPPRAKRLTRKIELLKIANDFNEVVVSEIITDQIKDELFTESTGLPFRGKKRALFTSLFSNLKDKFQLYQFRLVQSYIVQQDDKLKMASHWRILVELVFFLIVYTLIGVLLALLLIISFLSNHADWVKFILLMFLTVDFVLILLQFTKMTICRKLRRELK